MKNKNLIKLVKNHKGFSLLEMLISLFIFSLIIVTSVSIFARVASTRQKTRDIQKNIEEARTALDLMAKNMRMSEGLKYTSASYADQRIYMFNASQGVCISYIFNNKKLQMSQVIPTLEGENKCVPNVGVIYWSQGTGFQNIMENNVTGRFIVTPTSTESGNEKVGKATVVLEVDGINLQTTVSFRDYNNIIQ